MTEEILHYREKRELLTRIFREMGIPRHLFHVLNSAELYLDKQAASYNQAKELIEELKTNISYAKAIKYFKDKNAKISTS